MDEAVVSALIMNTPVRLKIDTGSNAPLAIRDKSWSKIFGNTPLEDLFDNVDVSGARVSNKGLKRTSISVGGHLFESYAKQINESDKDFDGYLGLPFFEDKLSFFDFRGKQLLLIVPQDK